MPITPTRMSFLVSVFSVVMNRAVRGTCRPCAVNVDVDAAAGETCRFESAEEGANAKQAETCKDTSSPKNFIFDQAHGLNGFTSIFFLPSLL
jgi:hypothetical protein